MLLRNKNLVLYGAGGAVGTAVAMAFAQEGAHIFLTDHKVDKIRKTAEEINENGGFAKFYQVDALSQAEVERHLDEMTAGNHHVDISFNLVSIHDVQGFPLIELEVEQILTTVSIAVKSHVITASASAKRMKERRTGVILMLTANAAKKPCENVGGFGIACAAMEALCRQFAAELGKHNIRAVCLRSAGSPDAPGLQEVFIEHARLGNQSVEEFERQFAQNTMLKRLPLLKEIADMAVLVSSDKASALTSAIVNVTCGELSD
jgi:3-oxoacyl-[acyl-carrier protein] reductase